MPRANTKTPTPPQVPKLRVVITFKADGLLAAVVHGDGPACDVRYSRLKGWHCPCPVAGRCHHIEAVEAANKSTSKGQK
jgi:hypothetical protein